MPPPPLCSFSIALSPALVGLFSYPATQGKRTSGLYIGQPQVNNAKSLFKYGHLLAIAQLFLVDQPLDTNKQNVQYSTLHM